MRQFLVSLKGITVICIYCDDITILSDRIFFMVNNELVTSIIRSDILYLDECINDDVVEIKL